MADELRKVLKAAEDQGWRIEPTKKGWKLYAPDGVNIVIVHNTPSDHRALKNTIARMRQYGFIWEGR
jgi:hypothetical protein